MKYLFCVYLFLAILASGAFAQSTTTNLTVSKPSVGSQLPNTQSVLRTGFDQFDAAIAGRLSKSVAGSSNVTLTTTEARNAILEFTGVLTGSINVIVPTKAKIYAVYNNTSGSFTLTVKTSGGTGITVTQGTRSLLYCDATNVVSIVTGGAGATAALDNLASVNINTALLAASGVDLGSTTKPFKDLYLYGGGSYGTNYFKFNGTPTSTQTLTIPDRTATLATTSGALTSGNCAKFDASGNIVDNGSTCAGSGLSPTGSSTTNGDITLVGQAVAGGDVLLDLTPGALTAVAAEVPDFVMRSHTTTVNATVADYNFNKFLAPTLAASSSRTTTNSATLYIDAAPTAGSNLTLTNPYALWVDSGNVRFDGFLGVGTLAPATTQFYVKAQSSGNVTAQFDSAGGATVDIIRARNNTTNVFVVDNTGRIAHSPIASTASTVRFNTITAADTGLSTGTEVPFARFGGDSSGATVSRQWNTGSLTLQRENIFVGPTYAFVGASTLTDAINVDIGTPTAGTNATITRSTGLRVKPAAAAHHGIWVDGTVSYTGDALALGLSGTKIVRYIGSGGTINSVFAANGALASNATDGFIYVPEYAATGAPSGTPTAYSGNVATYYQRDNVNAVYTLWGYMNSGWRDIGGQYKRYDTASGGGSQTLDFNSSSSANVTRAFTATAAVTFTAFNNPPPAGSSVTLILIQDGTGGWSWSFPSSVKFPSATAPTWSTGAGKKDTATFVWDGSAYLMTSYQIDVR